MSDRVQMMSSGDAVMSEGPNYYYENKEYLYKIIKKQLGITDEEMYSPSVVKQKVRDANIDKVLE